MEEPIFLRKSDVYYLVASSVGTPKNSASQSRENLKKLLPDIKKNRGSILKKTTQRHNSQEQVRRIDMNQDDCKDKNCASTQVLLIKENLLVDLQEHLEQYFNVLPVFGFSSAKCDFNLIKSYLLPIPVNERDVESAAIKKANQFISFTNGDIELLDNINFFGGAKILDSILKAYKTPETKIFFLYKWCDCPDKMQNTELLPYDAFYSEHRSCNPLEAGYNNYVDALKSGKTTGQAIINLKLPKPPPTGVVNYQNRQQFWKQQQMSSFRVFLRWYNNIVFVPLLKAMQKKITIFHVKISISQSLVVPYQTWQTFVYTKLNLKILSTHRGTKKTVGENSRCFWWSSYRFYTQSSCWWNFYPKVYKYMQINCGDWCCPTIPLLDVSPYAHGSSYAARSWSTEK